MKIIIAGAGDVGFHLAKLLSGEAQDIVLIDTNQEVLDYAQSHVDVLTVKGDSTSLKVLKEADVKNADLLIAATSSENCNIVTAVIGKKMGAAKTIARISKTEYLSPIMMTDFQRVGIDALISPRQLAANEIFRLINEAALTDIFEFEEGKLCLIGITLDEVSMITDHSIIDISRTDGKLAFRPIAIQRGDETIIPRGATRFKINDHIYFITKKESIDSILELMGKKKVKIKKIMIIGGGSVGYLSARLLEKEYDVKLIERNKDKCLTLAEQLNDTLVINGDGSNVELLEEEGLADMDALIALASNSETNIISCLVAKNHDVHKTIALVENADLTHLSQRIGVDTLINRKLIAANNIFRHIRKGGVKAIARLHGVKAEVIEYEVMQGAKITGDIIRNINFPRNAIIGGVVRDDKGHIPLGDFQVQVGDKVVVFTLPDEISNVEKFFN